MVIPILMLLCSSVSNWSDTSRIKLHVMEQNVTLLMTSNYFRQYIAGYTDANSLRYPIRRRVTKASAFELGDNCIQNFHLGRYIIGYMVGNLARDFRTYIRRYTSLNENFDMVIPILMHICSLMSNWSVARRIQPYVIALQTQVH